MLNWLKQALGGTASSSPPLDQRLAAYPPYDIPHPGRGDALRLDEARANLAALLAQREARLAAIVALLRDAAGIDFAPSLAGADPAPALAALHRWVNEVMPVLHRRWKPLATRARWHASARRGDEIVYAFLGDLALLLGELIIRGRPSFGWELDLDEANGRDGMETWRRPVLIARRADGSQIEIDVEAVVVARFFAPSGTASMLDGWSRLVQEARAGDHERVF